MLSTSTVTQALIADRLRPCTVCKCISHGGGLACPTGHAKRHVYKSTGQSPLQSLLHSLVPMPGRRQSDLPLHKCIPRCKTSPHGFFCLYLFCIPYVPPLVVWLVSRGISCIRGMSLFSVSWIFRSARPSSRSSYWDLLNKSLPRGVLQGESVRSSAWCLSSVLLGIS